MLGFAIGGWLMAAALLWKRRGTWGRFEMGVLLLVLACLTVWKFSGPRGATVAATAGICLAGIPGLVALWKNPDRHVAKIWAWYALANAVAFFGGTAMTLEERFAPGAFTIYSLLLAAAGVAKNPSRSRRWRGQNPRLSSDWRVNCGCWQQMEGCSKPGLFSSPNFDRTFRHGNLLALR